jgi:hypothetical protein
MANNEGVDIIIKAQDQYTKTINTITASNELFGKSLKNTEKQLAATEKYMIALRVNGVDPLDKRILDLKGDYDRLKQSLSSGEAPLRQSSRQWTNIALVIQDLPYGFRAIQNNLPALIGGVAGLGGAAYLAFSVIVAGLTFYDEAQRKAAAETKKLKESQDEYAKSLTEATGNAYSEIAAIKSLVEIAGDSNEAMDKRLIAVSKLQKEYPAYFGNLNKEQILNGNVASATFEVANAILARARARVMEERVGKLTTQQLDAERDRITLQKENIALTNEKIKLLNETNSEETDALNIASDMKLLDEANAAAKIRLNDVNNQIRSNTDKINKLIAIENSASLESVAIRQKLNGVKSESIKLDQQSTKPDTVTKEKEKVFDLLNYTKTYYDAKLAFAVNDEKEQIQILNEEQAAYDAMYALKIISDIEYAKSSAQVYKQIYAIRNNLAKQQEVEDKKISDRELQNSLDALKIESDVAMKIANSTGKSTASERIAILEQYKTALYDLASMGGWTAEQLDKISDALIRVDGEIKGSQDNLKDYKITWTDTMNSINKSILDFVANSINYLAESLGKALAGENIQVFKGLALLLADSLIDIGKALVAYAVPVLLALTLLKKPSIPTAIAAIAAGTAAIVAGSFLKSKLSKDNTQKFANGGIISGPTMGLMGEYPGAASNPEVVAPLDKLQSLIGGVGGNLEARISGNDLLILMNKAGRNNQNTF